ncbi:Tyrosyl-tRNA synthetase TyrS [Helicobacter suis]|nr:Tyrosyl-tRNA synthetase TyrS [Helicobacter suis]BCD47873.1 Tyrosyl-tRNA synthetase TyrS [Helicobacter suis]BCD49633.1 Tyrosyl-tRNA synthetase TyrS [Helicobacter suis]BCD50887.1 Tyrosyl-tRNA synthetase TyrS [Helicobacter suis]BCD70547.1 Tyrosyl-tRNA synthetase TyrS [Helicobacter suis]
MELKHAMADITRGMGECIGLEYLQSLVERFYNTSNRFSAKAGFDPTAPDLHLGHMVLLNKLATLQRHGARVQFVIGDFTATIGDPSGKSETRKILSFEEVLENAKTYKEQVFKILDPDLTDVCFNSAWLKPLGAEGLLVLTSKFSVARMLERDDFEKRYKENKPISVVEFMYPLLQGYDSVALECDIELGGNDQKFNLLVGRFLQRSYGLSKEQSVLTMPLLEGLDGVHKMSKSLGNYIGVSEDPKNMYAKLLSISDDLMWRYYELLSAQTSQQIALLKQGVQEGKLHPKTIKEELALEITTRLHSLKQAQEAKAEFDRISHKQIPSELVQMQFSEGVWIGTLLKSAGLSPSTSQARRDIKAGGVRINQVVILDEQYQFSKGSYVVQVGKRKFIRAIIA